MKSARHGSSGRAGGLARKGGTRSRDLLSRPLITNVDGKLPSQTMPVIKLHLSSNGMVPFLEEEHLVQLHREPVV